MRDLLERQLAECQSLLARLSRKLGLYGQVFGSGAARASAELGAVCLKLARVEEMCLGDYPSRAQRETPLPPPVEQPKPAAEQPKPAAEQPKRKPRAT
jgi:hypothetical protein